MKKFINYISEQSKINEETEYQKAYRLIHEYDIALNGPSASGSRLGPAVQKGDVYHIGDMNGLTDYIVNVKKEQVTSSTHINGNYNSFFWNKKTNALYNLITKQRMQSHFK